MTPELTKGIRVLRNGIEHRDILGTTGKGLQVREGFREEVIHLGKCQQFVGLKLRIRLEWKKEKVRDGKSTGLEGWGKSLALPKNHHRVSTRKSQDLIYISKSAEATGGGQLAGQEWVRKASETTSVV